MKLDPHSISSGTGRKRAGKRLGRGNASGKGTYSARGLKGQKARSGGSGGLQLKGFKQSLQKVPKLRGFKSFKAKPQNVSLNSIERVFSDSETVTLYALKEKGLISRLDSGAKILANGTLTKKLNFNGCTASKKAAEIIEKAGGSLSF
ncbi:MAG: 50S ribosomal protein L15 [Candidatus Magasanikbacteria bacterium]|nr:50S ribosomal protein L15 [Candidatus Magasanikbacteria bacterium]